MKELFINANNLQNSEIYNFYQMDIQTDNSIMITSKHRYYEFANWFLKNNKENEKFNLRMSKTKLKTRTNQPQFVLIMKKFHPWTEELNRIILRIEVECFANVTVNHLIDLTF